MPYQLEGQDCIGFNKCGCEAGTVCTKMNDGFGVGFKLRFIVYLDKFLKIFNFIFQIQKIVMMPGTYKCIRK